MTARRRLALWLAGAGAGFASAIVVADSSRTDHPVLAAVLVVAVGWAFIVGGLVALERRPENRFGLLMVAEGFAWFVASLASSDRPWVFTLGGFVFGTLYLAVLGHTILAYPTGRLEDRASRIIVALAYLITTVGNLVILPFAQPADLGCDDCPSTPAALHPPPGLRETLSPLTTLPGRGLCLAAAAVLARRWRMATPAARRVLAPVFLAGAIAIGALA